MTYDMDELLRQIDGAIEADFIRLISVRKALIDMEDTIYRLSEELNQYHRAGLSDDVYDAWGNTLDEELERRHAEAVAQFMEYYGYPPDDEDHSDLDVVEDILSHVPVQDIEIHNQSMSYATDPDFIEFETREQYARWYEAEEGEDAD